MQPQSEPQRANREGSPEGSGERSREPMNKNRMRGQASWGKRAVNREASAAKGRRGKSGGDAVKVRGLTWGYPALRLKGWRVMNAWWEVSRGRISRVPWDMVKGRTGRRSETTLNLEAAEGAR